MLEFGGKFLAKYVMSPERIRLSKGTRRRIRQAKSHLRHDIGLIQPSPDSTLWYQTEEILRIKLGEDYGGKYAPHTRILREFFDLRLGIKQGDSLDKVKEFQEKYDPELLRELAPVFIIIRGIIGK